MNPESEPEPQQHNHDQPRQRSEPRKPFRLMLFAQPRTGSHCFMRLFEKHPGMATVNHPMAVAAVAGPERSYTGSRPYAQAMYASCTDRTFRKDYDNMLAFIAAAENEKKVPLMKEHPSFIVSNRVVAQQIPDSKRKDRPEPILVVNKDNLDSEIMVVNKDNVDSGIMVVNKDNVDSGIMEGTSPPLRHPFVFPTSFVATLAPVILIRHPAYNVPSLYKNIMELYGHRPHEEEFRVYLCFAWSRLVYEFWAEFFEASGGKWPVVVDFDELVGDERGVTGRFCERAGIDPSGVQFSWEKMSDEAFGAQMEGFQMLMESLQKSTGIVKPQGPWTEPDLDEEEKKWVHLHGVDVAAIIRKLVDESMEDYKFLRAKCV